MIRVFIVLVLLLAGCSKKNSTDEVNSPDDEVSFTADAGFEDSGTNEAFPGFIRFLETRPTAVPLTYYGLLKLDTADYVENVNFFNVDLLQDVADQKILVVGKGLGCSTMLCGREIKVYRLNKEHILRGSESMEFNFQSTPKFTFEHEMFLVITDNVKDFEENDNGAMSAKSEPYDVDYVIVDFENRISGIDGHAAGELRIMRNYIFARYGYKFASADLSEYFKKFDWYKPQYDNVDEKLTATDKKIINAILAVEKK